MAILTFHQEGRNRWRTELPNRWNNTRIERITYWGVFLRTSVTIIQKYNNYFCLSYEYMLQYVLVSFGYHHVHTLLLILLLYHLSTSLVNTLFLNLK
jgi:hypothetical protein